MEKLTTALRVHSRGEDEKCSVAAAELSMQPYASMSLQDASEGFLMLTKVTSLEENTGDEVLDEEEGESVKFSNNNVAGNVVVCGI